MSSTVERTVACFQSLVDVNALGHFAPDVFVKPGRQSESWECVTAVGLANPQSPSVLNKDYAHSIIGVQKLEPLDLAFPCDNPSKLTAVFFFFFSHYRECPIQTLVGIRCVPSQKCRQGHVCHLSFSHRLKRTVCVQHIFARSVLAFRFTHLRWARSTLLQRRSLLLSQISPHSTFHCGLPETQWHSSQALCCLYQTVSFADFPPVVESEMW